MSNSGTIGCTKFPVVICNGCKKTIPARSKYMKPIFNSVGEVFRDEEKEEFRSNYTTENFIVVHKLDDRPKESEDGTGNIYYKVFGIQYESGYLYIEFEVLEKISETYYSEVFVVLYEGKKYALKILKKGRSEKYDSIINELNASYALSELGVGPKVDLHGLVDDMKDKDAGFILMEKFDYTLGSDEFTAMNLQGKLQAYQSVAQDLEKLHSLNLAHNDIKQNNIMFNLDGEGNISRISIIDFGMLKEQGQVFNIFDAADYFPPDVITETSQGKVSSDKIDSFQLVYALLESVCEVILFEDLESYRDIIQGHVRLATDFKERKQDIPMFDNLRESNSVPQDKKPYIIYKLCLLLKNNLLYDPVVPTQIESISVIATDIFLMWAYMHNTKSAEKVEDVIYRQIPFITRKYEIKRGENGEYKGKQCKIFKLSQYGYTCQLYIIEHPSVKDIKSFVAESWISIKTDKESRDDIGDFGYLTEDKKYRVVLMLESKKKTA